MTRCSPNQQLAASRRRRESNPLDAALQAAATPCDLSVEKVESRELRVEGQIKQVSSFSGPQLSTINSQPKCPCQESNLVYDLRRVACVHHTPRTIIKSHYRGSPSSSLSVGGNPYSPPRNRTSPDCFEGSHASSTPAGQFLIRTTAVGLRPRYSLGGLPCFRSLESNQGLDLRRVPCNPLHYRDKQHRLSSLGDQDR